MIGYCIKRFVLHFVVAIFYLGVTSYWFVTKGFNPIKSGLQQDLLMLIHLITASVFPIANKNAIKRKHLLNFMIVILIIITYLALSNWIWNWLWSLR